MENNEHINPDDVNKKFDAVFSGVDNTSNTESKEEKNNTNANQTKIKNVMVLPALPNASTAFALGIVAIVLSVLWCYGVFSLFGLICGIVALVLARDGKKLSAANPGSYNSQSVSNNDTAKILGIIAIVMGSLGILGTLTVAAILFFIIEKASDGTKYI